MTTGIQSPFRAPDTFMALDGEARGNLKARAEASPRRRAHRLMHASHADPVQRLALWLKAETYIPPHRHPERWEMAVWLGGALDVLVFDDTGSLDERHRLGPDCPLVEIPAGTWHAYSVVDGDDAAFLEIKAGPHDDATGTEFAPFAPREDSADVVATNIVARLRTLLVGASLAPAASHSLA